MINRFLRQMFYCNPDDPSGGTPPEPPVPPVEPPTPPAVTFTQADLDRVAAKARAEGKKVAADEAKAAADLAAMTEAERLKKVADDATAAATDATSKANTRIAQAEAKTQAALLGVAPESIKHVLTLVDLSEVIDADGNADEAAIKKAVESVLTDVPAFRGKVTPPGDGGAGGGNGGGDINAQIEAAIKRGDVAESIRLKDLKLQR